MSAGGVRARVRAELTREIADVARRHLGESGAAGLSLRAVARELGMASSAVYRYFPSRDDLLTTLIIDAYDAVGAAAEAAAVGPDLLDRWRAACQAVRAWALAHPHEWALVYGSPVPGYAAPQATTTSAARVPAVLIGIVGDGLAAGVVTDPGDSTDGVLRPGLTAEFGLPVGPEASLGSRAVFVWSGLIGAISCELFGQFVNVVDDLDGWFADTVDRFAAHMGLPVG